MSAIRTEGPRPPLVARATLFVIAVGALAQLPLAEGFPAGGLAGIGVLALTAGALWLGAWATRGKTAYGGVVAALALLVLVSAIARAYDLMGRAAWSDEMWTLRNIYTSDWGTLLRVALDDYWPPLHYIILSAVSRVGSTELFWLRFPSLIFGVATIPAAYWLGRELFDDRWAALLTAALLAGMTYHVQYSQEARVYALLVLLATLSGASFYRAFWERRVSAAFVLLTVLLTYAHSFAAWYYIAGQWCFIGLMAVRTHDRTLIRPAVVSQLAVLASWIPLALGFAWSRLTRDIAIPTNWATGSDSFPTFLELLELYQTLAIRSWAGAAFVILGVSLALFQGLQSHRSRAGRTPGERTEPGPDRAVLFLLCCVMVPVFVSLAVTAATSLNTFPAARYHIAILPSICALVAGGLATLRTAPGRAMVAGVVVLLPAAELPRYYDEFTRPAYDEIGPFVAERHTEGEPILAGNGFRAFAYYYRGIFPRIGSPQWDSLSAAHADERDRYTVTDGKYGDSYAHEKLPSEIIHFTPYFELGTDVLQAELDAGRLHYPFWVVSRYPGGSEVYDDLRTVGFPCDEGLVRRFERVEVRRCVEGGLDG